MKRTDGPPPANICSICCMSCCWDGLAAERGLDPVAMAGGGGFLGGMLPPVVGGAVRPKGDLERNDDDDVKNPNILAEYTSSNHYQRWTLKNPDLNDSSRLYCDDLIWSRAATWTWILGLLSVKSAGPVGSVWGPAWLWGLSAWTVFQDSASAKTNMAYVNSTKMVHFLITCTHDASVAVSVE